MLLPSLRWVLLIPFGFGLDLVATASEKLIPFLTALGDTFTTIVQPAITIAKELFDTLQVTISTIGDTIQSITETVGGVFTTAIETARNDIALAVVDAVADGFDSTIELIKFLEATLTVQTPRNRWWDHCFGCCLDGSICW